RCLNTRIYQRKRLQQIYFPTWRSHQKVLDKPNKCVVILKVTFPPSRIREVVVPVIAFATVIKSFCILQQLFYPPMTCPSERCYNAVEGGNLPLIVAMFQN
uniref:Uncharacterized protein n=1 Tax=Parascaris univalens TaxID=6257 RepID=A0A915CEH3_PARUN